MLKPNLIIIGHKLRILDSGQNHAFGLFSPPT